MTAFHFKPAKNYSVVNRYRYVHVKQIMFSDLKYVLLKMMQIVRVVLLCTGLWIGAI